MHYFTQVPDDLELPISDNGLDKVEDLRKGGDRYQDVVAEDVVVDDDIFVIHADDL